MVRLLKTSADDPAVVALDERLKKVEAPFEADAKERAEAASLFAIIYVKLKEKLYEENCSCGCCSCVRLRRLR